MDNIKVTYCNTYQDEDIKSLVITAFRSKFSTLVTLDESNLISLINHFWEIPHDSYSNKQVVIKDNHHVCATMLIKRKSNKKEHSLKLDYLSLSKQYGHKNVIKLIAGLLALEHSVKKGEWYIDHIAVDKDYRGKGIGKALILWAQDFIEQGGKLTLFVSAKNKSAIHLYKKEGFQIKNKKISFWRWILLHEPSWYFMEWKKY
jgi:ribosomal protein S18 acetylase RimI-like enzyme